MPALQTYAAPVAPPPPPMPAGRPALSLARPGRSHPQAALDALLDALRSERRLLDDLASTMRRQRTAVGTDDLQAVDDSVFATHRILATLGQARVRRRQINRVLAGVEELPARALDEVLGEQMTDDIRVARDDLQGSAGSLAREVEVNRRVLRDALAAGETHARTLAGVPAAGSAGAKSGATLLDRTA